jgi:hypothetical protein
MIQASCLGVVLGNISTFMKIISRIKHEMSSTRPPVLHVNVYFLDIRMENEFKIVSFSVEIRLYNKLTPVTPFFKFLNRKASQQ